MLTNPSRGVYVALVNGQITGFTILIMKGAFTGYLQTICVAPGWRKEGIGRELISFAEKRIFSESPTIVRLGAKIFFDIRDPDLWIETNKRFA